MCGILAIARSRPIAPHAASPVAGERALNAAIERLRHRGPDGRGRWTSPCRRILLAHTRLAIQDLSDAGAQPMVLPPDDHPPVVITYNGEIYNAPDLRRDLERQGAAFRSRSDTEILLHGFRHWGLRGLLDRLHGMYAFVLVDRREPARPVLHAAVDHAGMKPLVYAAIPEGGLALASDADALLALLADEPGFARRLDGTGLCHVLSVGYCPAPFTVWRGVRKLAPGECLTWPVPRGDPPRIERSWSPPAPAPSVPADDAAHDDPAAFGELLESIVEQHLLADVPVGLFLSGGLDSSAIAVALARRGLAGRVTACTLTARGLDAGEDESRAAAALAACIGMRHRVIELDAAAIPEALTRAAAAFDEPQGFNALLTATELARGVASADTAGARVFIGGDGGDETLAGYAWHLRETHPLSLADPDAPPTHPDPRITALAARSYPHRYLCRLYAGFHPDESRRLLGALEPEYDADLFAAWLAPEDRPDLPHPRRAQRLDLRGFCAGSILPKLDRAAMHAGLELRAPFLDRRLIEWGLGLPPDARRSSPDPPSKRPLRAYLARAVDDGLAPAGVLSRCKQGFSLRTPERRPFTRLADGLLPASRLIRDGVLRRDFSTALGRDPETHEQRLFSLCMLAAWYERRA